MMERLEPPSIKFRILYSPIWPVLAVVFFITSLVMASLLIWMAAKPSQQAVTAVTPNPDQNTFEIPCPRQPPLLELPNPLPQAIKDSLTLIHNNLTSTAQESQNKSAISVNIFYRDKVIWRGHYGSKVYKGSNAPDDDTRYRIGSVTKIFPVLLLYKLYEDGIITSLDDPLNKYAPNFHINNPFTGTNITLRQIASQMSGLPREASCGFACDNTTSSEQLAFLRSQNLVIEPWTSPSYSNLGYALLGRLLTENLLNTTFEEWVDKQILQPLGMKDTGFGINKKFEENMALPYGPDGKVLSFMRVGWAGPAGNMYSTSNDLMKLAKMFTTVDGQGILKRETIRQILLPDYITRDGLWLWGSPWEMRFVKGFVARQKGGNIDSYNAVVSVIPEMKMGLSVMVNTAPALPAKSMSCFVIADLIHTTFLPALNKTLFEMRRHQSFPIDSKPFLGEYLVTIISSTSSVVKNLTANITSNMDTLLVQLNDSSINGLHSGFVLKYIGKPLLFQATLLPAVNTTCLIPRLGVLGMVTFDAPETDGLCGGFSTILLGDLYVGKRTKSSINKALPRPAFKQKTSSRKFKYFLFDQPYVISGEK